MSYATKDRRPPRIRRCRYCDLWVAMRRWIYGSLITVYACRQCHRVYSVVEQSGRH